MKSLWEETIKLPKFPSLMKDCKTEVLIIGGGMAGLLCAYFLKQAGIEFILVEAKNICSGITKDTTAKITSQHRLIYDKLIRTVGIEKAAAYLKANQEAVEQYYQMGKKIDCDMQRKDAYVYSIQHKKKLERELDALHKLKFQAEYVSTLDLPFPTAGAVKFPEQAQFHPLKFMAAIAKDFPIYENTTVREFKPYKAITEYAVITAEKMIIATHFPFINTHGNYFLKLYQHRSYVIALKNAPNINGMYVDEAEKGMSFRNADDLLLIGGGSHRTGKKGGNWNELSVFAKTNYPKADEIYRWATQDCMSLDGIPYIGEYAKHLPGVYVATGFCKWGMTTSMVAARLLCDLVQGKENEYKSLYRPARTILKPQLAVNSMEATINFLTPTTKRCPHLGCALKWNAQENSWDCSCHGSRFEKNGTIIDNPATKPRK